MKQGWFSSLVSSFILHPSSFASRSEELEHLDKSDYTSEEYEGCLVELRRINRLLGDAFALKRSLLSSFDKLKLDCVSVLDVGAGSGELLRVIARWGNKRDCATRLVGIELNRRSAAALLEESIEFPSISSVRANAFHLPFADAAFDYVICSLFLHHFRDGEAVQVLHEFRRVARRGIVIIDLHRHQAAYTLYTTLGRLMLRNRLVREDGALSIRRGFKADELRRLAYQAELTNVIVERRFPYRLVLRASVDR